MPFGLDLISVLIGIALGMTVVPYVWALLIGMLGSFKGSAKGA